MRDIESVAKILVELRRYRYAIERYSAGLKRLTIVARPLEDLPNGEKFITFRTVKYLQMPTYWEKAPFVLGTQDECRTLLESVGIEIVKKVPNLFYAQLPKSRIYVVCGDVSISDEMPP